MKQRITGKITGRVQMVMFRDFANRKARRLGLTGTVRNLADGSVAVIAEGEEGLLNRYIELLHKGSFLSRVDAVQIERAPATGEFKDFSIRY